MQDNSRRKEQKSPNCQQCIHGDSNVAPKFNVGRGRKCWKFSKPHERKELISIQGTDLTGETEDSLVKCVNYIREYQGESGENDFDKVMRGLDMCVWSWPIGSQEQDAFWYLSHSVTEGSVKYPYPNLSLHRQPNLFFEFLNIFLKARSDYMERKSGKNQS